MNKPKRLPKGINHKEAGDFYAKCCIAQMENDNGLSSDIYAEWARIEYAKAGFLDLAKRYDARDGTFDPEI